LLERIGCDLRAAWRFQAWSEAGIFRRLFEKIVRFYDNVRGGDWEWASIVPS
jgi:hypothetical protein